jgi:glycosyltransferase involved in cell wall biosynthesis
VNINKENIEIIFLGRYCKNDILGGPQKVAKRIYENYTKQNKSLFIEYFFDGKEYGFLKKLLGKETVEKVNGSDVYRMGIVPLFVTLLKLRPKIIHIITFERFAVVSSICKMFFNVKIIINMHGLIIHENRYFRKINFFYYYKDKIAEEIFVKYSDLLLILSLRFKVLLNSYYRLSERKIKYIKNGVDPEYYLGNAKKEFKKNNIIKIVFIADIKRKEKGFLFLKNSLEMIENNIELYVIDKKDNVISFKNNFVKVICFNKMSSGELANFLADKDIFISASYYEPFSISTVECISAGLIPVLTKETGASELIKDGVNGFLYDWGDKKKLNDIIIKLNNDEILRNRVSNEAVKIYNELKWEKIIKEYTKIYKNILLAE